MSQESARQRQQYRDILEEGDRMRIALAAFEGWAEAVIPTLGATEAADFGRDRIAQSQAARTISMPSGFEAHEGGPFCIDCDEPFLHGVGDGEGER